MIAPRDIEESVRALVTVGESNLGLEVTLPVIYPDGECVTVVVEQDGSAFTAHDAGGGAMSLTAAGGRLSSHVVQRLRSLVSHYGCELVNQRVTRRADAEHLAVAIAMVANASRTVGDQALEIRRKSDSEFRKSVTDRLREIAGRRIRENETVKGDSGRPYRVTSIVLDAKERAPLAFVEAFPNRNIVLNHFAAFVDLRQANPNIENVSVYDETETWRPEDFRLLGRISEVMAYSQSNHRLAKFGRAA